MNFIRDIVGQRPFVLDVTADEKYSNPQIEDLLDEENGFFEWQFFLQKYSDLNVIPAIHVNDEEDFSEVNSFVAWASEQYTSLALRLPYNVDDPRPLLQSITDSMDQDCSLLVLIDADYVSEADQADIVRTLQLIVARISTIVEESRIVVISSTFPRTPAEYGGDSRGSFEIRELEIFDAVAGDTSIQYGDYASIHPRQYEMRGGTWVPRVDVPLDENHIYTRYRRHDGGYVTAAKKMLANPDYQSFGCWGDAEIELAAADSPSGKNPSYWISVRMNIHISRRAAAFS